MKQAKKITDKKMIYLLFGLCWVVYFATYIGRLNYSSAMTAIIGESVLTKTQAGCISMAFFFCYGAGQLINGILGDKFSSRKMIFVGLFVSALANFSMSFFTSYAAMVVFWGINGYVQAMIWPPIIRIFSDMLHTQTRIKCCINITSSMALGTIAAYLLSAGMISLLGWKSVFWAAAIILGVLAFVWDIGFRKVEQFSAEFGETADEDDIISSSATLKKPSVPLVKLLISSGLIFILIPVIVHGVLKDGVTAWVPTYISETFTTTPQLSILVTIVLPIVNLTGAYAANFVNTKIFKNELKTSVLFFLIASMALLGLWQIGNVSMALSIALLAIITSSMLAVNTIFVNLIPLKFSSIGRASTVSGFLNSTAYLGAAISTFTIGVMVERKGWDFTILSWLIITVAACVICFCVRKKSLECSEK